MSGTVSLWDKFLSELAPNELEMGDVCEMLCEMNRMADEIVDDRVDVVEALKNAGAINPVVLVKYPVSQEVAAEYNRLTIVRCDKWPTNPWITFPDEFTVKAVV